MARQFFFTIALLGVGVLLNSAAEAVSAARCEDQAANCLGRCVNPSGGTGQNKCLSSCNRQVNRCLTRAHDASRWW
jgi:hypothetical protein